MDAALVERIRSEMQYEYSRRNAPKGFPALSKIPTARYYSDEFFSLELEHMWTRVWKVAGRAEDIPTAGSYIVWDAMKPPIVIIRGEDDRVRAFYNTCSHRGSPVVRSSCGTAKRLRCRYHSWTYNTKGELVGVPDAGDFGDLDWKTHGLRAVRCEVFDGWIFINEDPDAKSLRDFLGPVAEELAQFEGEGLRTVRRTSRILPANWKLCIEGFSEIYHFPHLHSREGFVNWACRGAAMGLLPNGHSRMVVPLSETKAKQWGMKDIWSWEMFRRPGVPDIASTNAMVRSASLSYSIFPNIIAVTSSVGMPFLTPWPIDATTTRFDVYQYGPDWGEGEPPPLWDQLIKVSDQVLMEDIENIEQLQDSLSARATDGLTLNYQERRIWHLHEGIDQSIGIERIPEDMRVEQLLGPYVER